MSIDIKQISEMLCASAYSSSVQSRVHAIDGLTYCSLSAMLHDDAVLSSAFKISMSFGLEPVTSELFKHLLRIFRPQEFIQGPADYLFILQ